LKININVFTENNNNNKDTQLPRALVPGLVKDAAADIHNMLVDKVTRAKDAAGMKRKGDFTQIDDAHEMKDVLPLEEMASEQQDGQSKKRDRDTESNSEPKEYFSKRKELKLTKALWNWKRIVQQFAAFSPALNMHHL
jgi:hypothetical protein